MAQKTFSWKITSEEKKQRAKALFVRVLILSLIVTFAIYIYHFVNGYWTNSSFLEDNSVLDLVKYFILLPAGVSLGFSLLIYAIKYFSARKTHAYTLTEEGIDLTKGDVNKHFAWTDFESFFGNSYTEEETYNKGSPASGYMLARDNPTAFAAATIAKPFVQDISKRISRNEVSTIGETLFLKLKRKGFWGKVYQVFIAVNLEPDTRQEIREFIKSKLKEKAEKDGSMRAAVYKYK